MGFGGGVHARAVFNFCKFEDEPRTDHALARLAILSPTRGWESRLRDAGEARVSRDHSVARDRFAARSNVKSPYVHQPRIFAEPSHRGGRNPGFWEARTPRAIKEEGARKGAFHRAPSVAGVESRGRVNRQPQGFGEREDRRDGRPGGDRVQPARGRERARGARGAPRMVSAAGEGRLGKGARRGARAVCRAGR